jgi:excisionase family DNA binding protein
MTPRRTTMKREPNRVPVEKNTPPPPPIAPMLTGVDGAARAFGLGRTKIYDLMSTGVLPFIKIGKRRLIPVAAMQAMVDELQAYGAAMQVQPAAPTPSREVSPWQS